MMLVCASTPVRTKCVGMMALMGVVVIVLREKHASPVRVNVLLSAAVKCVAMMAVAVLVARVRRQVRNNVSMAHAYVSQHAMVKSAAMMAVAKLVAHARQSMLAAMSGNAFAIPPWRQMLAPAVISLRGRICGFLRMKTGRFSWRILLLSPGCLFLWIGVQPP